MFKQNISILLSGISCLSILAGCANLNSIHRKSSINEPGQTEFIDAKQRAVLVNKMKSADKDDPLYRICSEPSPDVFSVFANSIAASVSKDSTGSLGASLGLSSAELGATIERTQTVNLMRDSLYSTCRDYMNGALDEETMRVQKARDQRMMVATLAIEQLTGVVKRKPTILSSQASVVMAAQAKELTKKLTEAEKATKDAEEAHEKTKPLKETADKDFAAKNKVPTKVPDDFPKACVILTADKPDATAVKIANTVANKAECNRLKKEQSDLESILDGEKKAVAAEENKLVDAKKTFGELNRKIDGQARLACVIMMDEKATDAEKMAVGAAPTKDQCDTLNKVIAEAPSKIQKAKLTAQETERNKNEAEKAYDAYNDGKMTVPATGIRPACDILLDENATDIEKKLVGKSPTKEECQTLKSKVNTTTDNEKTASTELEQKKVDEEAIRKQLLLQTDIYLSAKGNGTGDDGSTGGSSARIEKVAGAVEKIALAAFNDNSEILFACSREIREPKLENADFRNLCNRIMATQFQINADMLSGGDASDIYNKAVSDYQVAYEVDAVAATDNSFNILWEKVKDNTGDGFSTTRVFSMIDAAHNDNNVFSSTAAKERFKFRIGEIDTRQELRNLWASISPEARVAISTIDVLE